MGEVVKATARRTKVSQRDVLRQILANGAAMSVLDSNACLVEAPRPPETDEHGRLVMRTEHEPVDPGDVGVTLGDLLRLALGETDG
jgi:hypothetical protein